MSPRGPCTCDEAMKAEMTVSGMCSCDCPWAELNSRPPPQGSGAASCMDPHSPALPTSRCPEQEAPSMGPECNSAGGHWAWARGCPPWGLTSVRVTAHLKEVWFPPHSRGPSMLEGAPVPCSAFTHLGPHWAARCPQGPGLTRRQFWGATPGEDPKRRGGEVHAEPLPNPRRGRSPWMWKGWAPLPPSSSPSPMPFSPGVEMVEIY